MKRVVIWGWHSPSAVAAVTSLEKRQQIKVVAWIGKAAECTHELNEFLHQFKLDRQGYSGAADSIYEQVYGCLGQFQELYSRVSFSMGRSFQEMLHIFNGYCDYFSALLRENKVDAVIFNNLPHFGVDNLLYEIAQSLGIKTVMTFQSLVPNRFFYVKSVDEFGNFNHSITTNKLPYLRIEQQFRKNLFYMKNIPKDKKCCVLSLANDLMRMVVFKKSKPMTLAGAFHKFENCREYSTFAPGMHVHNPDITANFVYFPLQLQPELTTATLGGIYADQLLAIERLSLLIPDDWRIYVKENPKQTRRQRDALFFERFARIRKAQYIPPGYDTYTLIENCRFVATVTGTVGWEAISGGKNALVFGKAWYRTLPGVFEYERKPALDDILNYRIPHQELEEAYNNLITRTMEGVMDPVYQGLVTDYSDEENARRLALFLESALSR